MKRKIAVLLVMMLCLALTACGVSAPSVTLGKSELYTEKEIRAAIDVVVDYVGDWEDRTLLRVKYDEDHTLREMKYRREHYGEETVIVLLTDIHAGLGALAVGPFYPGQTCTDYQFILTRDDFGRWNIQDMGYA